MFSINLPNIISLARLFSVPILVWLVLNGQFQWALWLFVGAGISDALDGYIAKRWAQTSTLGTFLDPVADKALLVGVYLTLGFIGEIPLWAVILVVFRDALIIGGVIMLHISMASVKMRPLLISKANTAFQISLAVWILGELGYGFVFPSVKFGLIFLVALSTILSGGAYIMGLFGSEITQSDGGDN